MKSIVEQFYYGNITPCETTVTDNRFKKIAPSYLSLAFVHYRAGGLKSPLE